MAAPPVFQPPTPTAPDPVRAMAARVTITSVVDGGVYRVKDLPPPLRERVRRQLDAS